MWFNVDYRHPPPKVIAAIESALRAAQIPNVAAVPPPNCVQMDFVESYCRYAVRYWLTELAADDPTDSAVRAHIYYALSRADIPLALPEQTVLLSQEKERAELQAEEAGARRAEAIHHVDIFAGLQPEEQSELARRLVPAPFASGDVITRQGATAHWLYVLVNGRADVIVQNPQGDSVKVAQLSPGSFFGEWGLLTGEPRHATVVARSDVECYRLDKESFRTVLLSRPAIAEEISALLAQRPDRARRPAGKARRGHAQPAPDADPGRHPRQDLPPVRPRPPATPAGQSLTAASSLSGGAAGLRTRTA